MKLDLTELLKTIESYAKDYVRYLLTVVVRTQLDEPAGEFDPKLMTYSVISLVIGYFIYDQFIRHTSASQGDLFAEGLKSYSVWLGVSVVYFGLVNLIRRSAIDFVGALNTILAILPVAFLMSAFAAEFTYQLFRLYDGAARSGWRAYGVMLGSETLFILGLLTMFTVRRLAPADDGDSHRFRRWAGAMAGGSSVALAASLIVLFARLYSGLTHVVDRAESDYAAIAATCAKDQACVARLFIDKGREYRRLGPEEIHFVSAVTQCKADIECVARLDSAPRVTLKPTPDEAEYLKEVGQCPFDQCVEAETVDTQLHTYLKGIFQCFKF